MNGGGKKGQKRQPAMVAVAVSDKKHTDHTGGEKSGSFEKQEKKFNETLLIVTGKNFSQRVQQKKKQQDRVRQKDIPGP